MSDDSPHKRKRSLDDTGDRDQKKMHLEDSRLGIEDLHLDVGEKYLLCKTRKAPSADLFLFLPRSLISTVAGKFFHEYICVNTAVV